MSTREEFAVAIRCPKCGHHGKSIWEETDGANCQHGPQRLLKFVSAGFSSENAQTQSGDPEIICDRCEAVLPD